MNTYLACFDISNDRTRYRVSKHLTAYGTRVQRSVFEVCLDTPSELATLKNEVLELIDEEDDVRFYALCLNCRRKSHTVDDQRIASFPSVVIL